MQFREHGLMLWDSGWYGGNFPLGYSVLFPAVAGVISLPVAAVASAVIATWAFDRVVTAHLGSQPLGTWYFAVSALLPVAIGQLPFLAGEAAVRCAISGETGKMIAFTREGEGSAYRCGVTYEPLSVSANMEKKVPHEWISESGTYVTREFFDYVLPLIQGENSRRIEHGLPRFAKLKKIKATV